MPRRFSNDLFALKKCRILHNDNPAKGVVILDTGYHSTSHPTDIERRKILHDD